MKNDKSQFVVRTSDFYLSLFICHCSFVICHWSFDRKILGWLRRTFGLVVQICVHLWFRSDAHRKFTPSGSSGSPRPRLWPFPRCPGPGPPRQDRSGTSRRPTSGGIPEI